MKNVFSVFEKYSSKKINIFAELKNKISKISTILTTTFSIKDYLYSLYFSIKQCGLEMNGMLSGWESQLLKYGKAVILLTPSGEYSDKAIGFLRDKHNIVLVIKTDNQQINVSIFNNKTKMFEFPDTKKSEFKITETTLAARTHEQQERKENS